jgi:hypothetical protein
MSDYIIVVDKNKWKESTDGFLKLLNNAGKIRDIKPLNLDDLLYEILKIKHARLASASEEQFEIWFPTLEARDQFLKWMKNPQTLIKMIPKKSV